MESAAPSHAPARLDTDHHADDSIKPAAILVWLLVQLIPLLIAGTDFPLFARPAEASSRYALIWIGSMQFAILSLLFPWLLANVRQSIFITAATPPFIALAGFMAQAAVASIVSVAVLVFLWICGLGIWRAILAPLDLGQIGISIASSVCIGGAVVTYLLVEFGDMNRDSLISSRGIYIALLIHLALAISVWIAARIVRAKLSTGFC